MAEASFRSNRLISVALAGHLAVAAVVVLTAWMLWPAAPSEQVVHHVRAELLDSVTSAGAVLGDQNSRQLAGSWHPVSLPFTFRPSAIAIGSPPVLETRWFRATLRSAGNEGSQHLYVPRWQVAGHIAVYGDGRLMYRSEGNPGKHLARQLSILLPLTPADDSPIPSELLIRLDSFSNTQGGISSFYTGPSLELQRNYALREWLQNRFPDMGSIAFLALGMVGLLIWLRRRQEVLFLLVALYAALHGLRQWILLTDLPQATSSEDGWVTFALINNRIWQLVVTHFILVQLHGNRLPSMTRTVLILGLAFTATTAALQALGFDLLGWRPAWLSLTLAIALWILGIGWLTSWRQSSADGLLLSGVLLCNTALSIYEALKVNLLLPLEWYPLYPYTIGIFALTLMFILSRRYVGALNSVEESNLRLSERLREREAQLQQSHRRLLAVEHQQTLAKERQRLMQDMHDGIGSSLTGAIRAADDGALGPQALASLLRSCLDDLKLTIDSLDTTEPDLPLLLANWRYRLAPHIQAAGIRLTWDVQRLPDLPWLDPSNGLNILRIVQECVANVLRHTRATELRISALAGPRDGRDGVLVHIQDNGEGFDVDRALRDAKGRGLVNQQRRATAVQGHIHWSSGPSGTIATLWLPLARSGKHSRRPAFD